MPALSFHLMPASEIHQRYITTPFDDLSQPFWCKRRAIVVQGRMQPVVHRPRGTRDVVVSRCSRPFVAGCRRVQRLTICGGGLDLAGCTQVAYREWTASGQVSRIGVMIASAAATGSARGPPHAGTQHIVILARRFGTPSAAHQLSREWDSVS